MNSMLQTIIPKSDQLNADDLIGGRSITIKITDVSIIMGDQPVALSYEGDGGKPYKPGKSMRRVLVNAWGPDAKLYIGRYLTLYRDDKVKFGGAEVGGIRISHMSHIDKPITMALTVTKANRKPFTVKPLEASTPAPPSPPAAIAEAAPMLEGEEFVRDNMREAARLGTKKLAERWTAIDPKYQALSDLKRECWEIAKAADEAAAPNA